MAKFSDTQTSLLKLTTTAKVCDQLAEEMDLLPGPVARSLSVLVQKELVSVNQKGAYKRTALGTKALKEATK
jgi:predicted ArsR family transcriptional regulator